MVVGNFVKIKLFMLAFAFAATLSVTQLLGASSAHAAGGTATWTGAAGDHKFSTAGNWAENAIPQNGDALVFNTEPIGEYEDELDNDVNVAYASVQIDEVGTDGKSFVLMNDISLQDGAQWSGGSFSGSRLTLDSTGAKIIGQGSLSILKGNMSGEQISIAGTLTLSNSASVALSPPVASAIKLKDTSQLDCLTEDMTFTMPIEIGEGNGDPSINAALCFGAVGGSIPKNTITFNNVTMKGNVKYFIAHPKVIKINKLVKNGYKFIADENSSGTLLTPDGSIAAEKKTIKLTGDKPSDNIVVLNKETAILYGDRGEVLVGAGGVLKGNGKLTSLAVSDTGTVAPGLSPGTITTSGNLVIGGTYEAEIYTASSYDKLVVSGDVTLEATSVLSTLFLPGGKINKGDEFTIIDNKGSNTVNGTFKSLSEGTKIAVGNATFSISYVGGDGNDVVLTALNTATAPSAPDTGFAPIIMKNPALVAVLGAASIIGLVAIRQRYSN